jgi:NAD(P)-dependent dehydrogenase (short-subunit alcohol dehydrogenase family)
VAWSADPESLRGRTAVVAGATRGAGRGIAAALGEAGATVVCTGRSSSGGGLRSDYPGRTETIEETAALVTALGGTGVAVAVDHLESDQVARLAARIKAEHGHIDILVNDIWGRRSSRAAHPTGTRRSGITTLTKGSGYCVSGSTRTSSPRTTCSR